MQKSFYTRASFATGNPCTLNPRSSVHRHLARHLPALRLIMLRAQALPPRLRALQSTKISRPLRRRRPHGGRGAVPGTPERARTVMLFVRRMRTRRIIHASAVSPVVYLAGSGARATAAAIIGLDPVRASSMTPLCGRWKYTSDHRSCAACAPGGVLCTNATVRDQHWLRPREWKRGGELTRRGERLSGGCRR